MSVENEGQRWRIEKLVQTPAAVRFVSYEPALGPLDILEILLGQTSCGRPDWLIFGGESGPSARPCNLQWARDVRDMCKAAGTAYFFKQAGAAAYDETGIDEIQYYRFRDPKGGDLSEIPEDLRIREFPQYE